MPSFRINRLAEDMKREMSAILRELKDPRVKEAMLSILRVEITNDLSHAKIYVTSMDGMESAKTAVEGLKNATGFIKRELCSVLKMRKCPELHFIPDDSIEFGAHLNEVFQDMHQKEASRKAADASEKEGKKEDSAF